MSQNFPKDINKYTCQVDSEFQLEVYIWMTKKFWKGNEGLLLLATVKLYDKWRQCDIGARKKSWLKKNRSYGVQEFNMW